MRDDAASHLMFSAAARMTYAESLDSLLHGGEEDTVGRVGQMYRQLVDARAKVLGDDAAARDAARAQLLAGFRTVLDQASDLIPTNRAPVVGPYLLDATKDVAVDSLLKRFETHYAEAQQEENREFRDRIPREYNRILAQAVLDAKQATGPLDAKRWISANKYPELANFLDSSGRVRPVYDGPDSERAELDRGYTKAIDRWLNAVARSAEVSKRGRVDGLRNDFRHEIKDQYV
jgi:hypothetical protein